MLPKGISSGDAAGAPAALQRCWREQAASGAAPLQGTEICYAPSSLIPWSETGNAAL